jgi:uncharacterized protein (TIGR02266 family)
MSASAHARRRRYSRRTVRVLVEYASEAGVCCDPATTLGAGGLFVETERPLFERARLKLRFRLPGAQGEHEIEGRVVWVRTPAESGTHAPGMGIEFTDRIAAARLARDLETLD